MNLASDLKITRTRFKEIGFACQRPGLWRFFDLTGEYPSCVGPQYRTRAELLGDLTRYCVEYGATEGA